MLRKCQRSDYILTIVILMSYHGCSAELPSVGWSVRAFSKKCVVAFIPLPSSQATSTSTLIEAAYQLPKGIVCLLSALRFHNFTTQSPHEIWMAIEQKAWAPKISSPPIHLIRMSGAALHFGVKQHKVSGAVLRVFTPGENCCRLLQVPEQDRTGSRHRSIEGVSAVKKRNDG